MVENAARKSRARAPVQRGKVPLSFEEQVWRALPPIGKMAARTVQVAQTVGVPVSQVLPVLNRLAAQGRAQRLYRDGIRDLEWRRQ